VDVLDGSCINVMSLLVSYVTCLCITGTAISLLYLILDWMAVISNFTALVVIASTLDLTAGPTNLFNDVKMGKI